MKILFPLAFAAISYSGYIGFGLQTPKDRQALAQGTIVHWSDLSRVTAAKLVAEYGPPDRLEPGRLTWYSSGSWKRTEVWDAALNDSSGNVVDFEQTVRHHVPTSKRPDLAVFGDLIRIPENGDEISARTGSEEFNYLAVNLVHQVLEGSITPEDARRKYDEVAELYASGKSSPYTQGLIFAPEP